jgi:hypothetical protein
MNFELFDMRDAEKIGDRQIVLRIMSCDNLVLIQSPIYATEDTAKNLADLIAAGLNTEAEWFGRPAIAQCQSTIASLDSLSQAQKRFADGLCQLNLF